MSKKCKAFSLSNLGLEPVDNRKAFYAGWDAALEQAEKQDSIKTERFFWSAWDGQEEYTPLIEEVESNSLEEAKEAALEYKAAFSTPVTLNVHHEKYEKDSYNRTKWMIDDLWSYRFSVPGWVLESTLKVKTTLE